MLLCTSDFEGFSNVFLEALAVGTPVVTRRHVDPDLIVLRHTLGASAEDEGVALSLHCEAEHAREAVGGNRVAQKQPSAGSQCVE